MSTSGTIDLFAALEILTGNVVTQFHRRHRNQEFRAFLSTIDRRAPKGFQLHIIADNPSADMTEEVYQWLHAHSRFHLHFTPTNSSWPNGVERWFSTLTTKALKRGSFASVGGLKTAIREYVVAHNQVALPFLWTKSPDEILRKIRKIQRLSVTPH
jgi:transposase